MDSLPENNVPNSVLPVVLPENKKSRRYIGIILTIVSSLTFSFGTLLVKILSDYNPFEVGVWRFQGIFLLSFPTFLYCWLIKGSPVFDELLPVCTKKGGKTLFLLCCRWFFGCSAIVLQFLSLRYISVADSLTITFSTPIFVTVVAHKFLNEKSGFFPIFIAIITIGGVAIMSRPGSTTEFDWQSFIGLIYAVASMVTTGISFVLMRYLRKVHFSLIITCFGAWGIVECLLLSIFIVGSYQYPNTLNDWYLGVGLAVLSYVGQSTLTLALKFEQASVVSILRSCDVIFGFIWQFLVLSVVPDMYSIIGATVVVLGVLLIGLRKWLMQLPKGHVARSRLCILLK